MCTACIAPGTELHCPTCRALTGSGGFPFTRTDHDFFRLWAHSWAVCKREWVMLSIAVAICMMVWTAASLVAPIFQAIGEAVAGKGVWWVVLVSQLLGGLATGVLFGVTSMGMCRVWFDALHGGRADLGRMFVKLFKIKPYMSQYVLVSLMFYGPALIYFVVAFLVAVRLGHVELARLDVPPPELARAVARISREVAPTLAVAFIVGIGPLVWFITPTLWATPEIVAGSAGGWDSIVRSYRLADGFRLSTLGYWLLFFPLAFIGSLVCCVGFLPAFALWLMLLGAKFLALRNGSGLPVPPAEEW